MGRCGQIVLFHEYELSRPVDITVEILRFAGAERIGIASRTIGPERSWQEFLNLEDDAPTEDFFNGFDDLHEAASLYRKDTCVFLILGRNRIGMSLYQQVMDAIPESIAGDFSPTDPVVIVGWHDLWEASEVEEGQFFGRSFLSLQLSGNGSPLQWQRYRELVFEVPAVKRLKADLERIVGGPMKQCVYWSV